MKKKVCSLCEVFFCGHAYSTDLIGHTVFGERGNREERSHTDRTNRHILEQMNREEKTLVSSLLIKSLYSDPNSKTKLKP